VAGIQAAKRAWELIPLCHPVALTGAWIDLDVDDPGGPHASVHVARRSRLSIGRSRDGGAGRRERRRLTIYDMLKAADRWMTITDLGLIEKSGGRSGHLRRGEP
jgi:cyclic pyranopterin phosphate synthase